MQLYESFGCECQMWEGISIGVSPADEAVVCMLLMLPQHSSCFYFHVNFLWPDTMSKRKGCSENNAAKARKGLEKTTKAPCE